MFISLSRDKEAVIASPYGRGGSQSETERVVCANKCFGFAEMFCKQNVEFALTAQRRHHASMNGKHLSSLFHRLGFMFISLAHTKETVIASPYGRGGSRSETERVVCANKDCCFLDRIYVHFFVKRQRNEPKKAFIRGCTPYVSLRDCALFVRGGLKLLVRLLRYSRKVCTISQVWRCRRKATT